MQAQNRLQLYFFIGLLLGVCALTLAVFWPFLGELVLAMILAIVLEPLYLRVRKKLGGKENISALLVVFLTCIVILVPLLILGSQLVAESFDFYDSISSSGLDTINNMVQGALAPLYEATAIPSIDVATYAESVIAWIIGNMGAIFTGTASVVLGIFLTLFALFFLLRDGEKVMKLFLVLSPLADEYDNRISNQLKQTVNSVVLGALAIALIQGLLVGFGLWIFGVPNPTLWGTVAAFSALIPGVGTALVNLPAVIFLFFTAGWLPALGMALWAILIVGFVDNMLLPYFYGRGSKIHPLLILFSVLGGIALFGPLGFLFGPIVISLFLVLIDMYRIFITAPVAENHG